MVVVLVVLVLLLLLFFFVYYCCDHRWRSPALLHRQHVWARLFAFATQTEKVLARNSNNKYTNTFKTTLWNRVWQK